MLDSAGAAAAVAPQAPTAEEVTPAERGGGESAADGG
jgi:hypothetical protein